MGGLDRVVEQHDAVVGERLLVRELRLDQRRLAERAEVHRLVPADAVVVDVHLAQHLHHLELVRLAVLVLVLDGIVRALARGVELGDLGLRRGAREAVGRLERAPLVEPEQRARGHLRQRVAAVLHDLEHDQPVHVHDRRLRRALHGLLRALGEAHCLCRSKEERGSSGRRWAIQNACALSGLLRRVCSAHSGCGARGGTRRQ